MPTGLKYTAINNLECPECSSGLRGSVYRPNCSNCSWDSNDSM